MHHSKCLMGALGYVPLSATTTRELHSRRPAVGGVRRGWHAGCDDGLRIRPNLSRNSVEHAGSSESGAQTRRLLELLAKFSPPQLFFFIFLQNYQELPCWILRPSISRFSHNRNAQQSSLCGAQQQPGTSSTHDAGESLAGARRSHSVCRGRWEDNNMKNKKKKKKAAGR